MTEVEKAAQFHWSATPYIGKEADAVIEAFIAGAAWQRERDCDLLEKYGLRYFGDRDKPLREGGVILASFVAIIRAQSEKAGEE